MKFPPAARKWSRIAKAVDSSVAVPKRIAPSTSALTRRGEDVAPPTGGHQRWLAPLDQLSGLAFLVYTRSC